MTNPDHHVRNPRAAAWVLLTPLLLWLAIFVVAPLVIMVIYSLARPRPLGGVEPGLTWSAYASVLNPPLLTSLLIGGITGIGMAGLAGSIALALLDAVPWMDFWWERGWRRFLLTVFATSGWLGVMWAADFVPGAHQLRVFVVSINYAIGSTVICVLIGYPVAYFMGRSGPRLRNALMLLIMVPFWTSFLIRTYAWVSILKGEGWLNNFLLWSRLIHEPLDILYTPTAVMIGLVYTYLPFMILPIYTSCERMEQSLIDAAFDLGAGPLRTFGSVILPLTMPGVIAGIVITFVPAIGMFAVNDILGGKTEPLIGNVITNQFFQARNWPQGAALGMILMILFLATYYLATYQRGKIS